MKFLIILIFILFSFTVANSQTFQGCGKVIETFECNLFLTDNGQYITISYIDYGEFSIGDHIFISADLVTCPGLCMGPVTCLSVNYISNCEVTFDDCGVLIQGTECVLFKGSDDLLYYVTDLFLNPIDDFEVGDYVRVRGNMINTFVSVCNQESASIIAYEVFESDCKCFGIRGNIDGDLSDQIDMNDLIFMVNYIFKGGNSPSSKEETDVNGSGEINIADLTYFVSYFFKGGDAPVSCP